MEWLRNLIAKLGRVWLSPSCFRWLGPLGCLILGAGIVGFIYVVFVPRHPLRWTWQTIFWAAYCADFAVAAAIAGIWGILRQVSQTAKRSRAVNRVAEGLLALLAILALVLGVLVVLSL